MSIESVTVSGIMVKDVKTATDSQTIKVIAKTMSTHDIGSVVIVDNDKRPVGILTEKDIVKVVASEGISTHQATAREFMSKPVFTLRETNSIKDALQQMQTKDIRRLPVVDSKNRMVGIVTDKDIFKALTKSQTLVTSFCESLMVEYKPIYDRLSEFMLGEMPVPGGNPSENF